METVATLLFCHFDLKGEIEISLIGFDSFPLAGNDLGQVSPISLLQTSIRRSKGAGRVHPPLATRRIRTWACARHGHEICLRVDGDSGARIHLNTVANVTCSKRSSQRTIYRLAASKRQQVVSVDIALGNESRMVDSGGRSNGNTSTGSAPRHRLAEIDGEASSRTPQIRIQLPVAPRLND